MRWCLDYENYLKTKEKTKEKIDEVIIYNIDKYKNDLERFKHIFDQLAEDHKRIIIALSESNKTIIDFLKNYHENYPITALICRNFFSTSFPYFRDIAVTDKETYNDMVTLNDVTDIYVKENLCFFMEHMRKPHNKNIRVVPCVAQRSGIFPKLCDFFIRPEDIPLYEDFVDVMDLSSVHNAHVLADIYINQKKWIGDLSEIIFELPKGFNGDGIIPDFGYRRLNCEKRCQNKDSQCEVCKRYAELSQNAKKNGIYFKA